MHPTELMWSRPGFFTSVLEVRECSELFCHVVDVADSMEKKSPCVGSDRESSGCLCIDTHFTFHDAAITQTAVKLVHREGLFISWHEIVERNACRFRQIHLDHNLMTFKIKEITNTHTPIIPVPFCFWMEGDSAHTAVVHCFFWSLVFIPIRGLWVWSLFQNESGLRQK